ncbi:MAG: YihY/virulence factor BrkB family protein [Phaeodactylibacter xiamenensis]|uniref:YihY/virulence factor BrkB family protein n=1 Tax=Phaeodactylibacter xiamenensis TaxID=1524460 RepID=UPI0005C706C4|nr:YihY/virulence factor BrkB family protein [Phaeodactylibacter xiamenensis]MCR9051335.1 YihY/virulence factor BrkB family protein [bacterium]
MKKPKIDIEAIQKRLFNLPIVKQVIEWSQHNSLPGFFKVPLYDVIVFIQNELKRNDLFTRSYAIAYNFFLSIFPSLIAFFTLIPIFKWAFIQYLPEGENFDIYLRTEIQRILPGVTGDRLFAFVDDITNNPRFGLLSIGFIFAIYFASNGMIALMRGFDKSYNKTFKSRNAFKKRFIAIGLTFLIGVLLIAAVVLIILGEFLLGLLNDFIALDSFTNITIQLLRWLAILLVFYMGIALIYRYGAAAKRRFAIFSPGTTLATILCIISSLAFSFYVNEFNTYNELYGSLGAIIALMLWIQINSLILLIGFELNASIAVNRDLKKRIPAKEV